MLTGMPEFDSAMAEIHQLLGKGSKPDQANLLNFDDSIEVDGSAWTFQDNIQRLRQLEQDWDSLTKLAEQIREIRQLDFDIDRMRAKGELKNGDTIIARRVIETNLRRLHPPFVQFITQPRRAVVLTCTTDRDVQPQLLEKDYTTLARYKYYEQDWFRLVDGAQLHGWASMLTLYDPSMPGKFRHKYIPFDRLFFPIKATNVQNCEYIVFMLPVTLSKLKTYIKKNGFNRDQVDFIYHTVNRSIYTEQECDEIVNIRLCMYKSTDGFVYTCWYHPDCTDWLRQPKPLYMGRKIKSPNAVTSAFGTVYKMNMGNNPLDANAQWEESRETEYPVEIHIAYDNEEEQITLKRGRGFYDRYIQAAQTSIWSSFVNQLRRASNVYASPANDKNVGEIAQLKNVQLIEGAVYNRAMAFWNMPLPSNLALIASQSLSSENASDTNQTAFTVMNRKDARKTKKEMDLAEQTQNENNSAPLISFASTYRAVHSRSFDIVMAQARQGELPEFLALDNNDPKLVQQQAQSREILLQQKYLLRSGGEVEIQERQEKLQMLEQMLPVVEGSPLKPFFLKRIVELAFPDDAESMKKILDTAMPEQALTNAAVTLLSGLVQKYGGRFDPEDLKGITQIIQQAQQSREASQTS